MFSVSRCIQVWAKYRLVAGRKNQKEEKKGISLKDCILRCEQSVDYPKNKPCMGFDYIKSKTEHDKGTCIMYSAISKRTKTPDPLYRAGVCNGSMYSF